MESSVGTAVKELQLLVTSLSQDNLTLSDDLMLQEIGDRLLGLLEAFPRHSDTSHQMKGHLSSIHAAAVTLWNVAVAFRASGNVSSSFTNFSFMILFIDKEIVCRAVTSRVTGSRPPVRARLPSCLPLQETPRHVPQDGPGLAGRGQLRNGGRSYRSRVGADGETTEMCQRRSRGLCYCVRFKGELSYLTSHHLYHNESP